MRKFLDFLEQNCGKTWFGFAVMAMMSVLTIVLPILFGGFRQTVDMNSHLHFAQAFRDGMAAGNLYPGWADDNFGFGSVGVRFYPPLTAFLTALLHLLSGNWHLAFSTSMFVWMLAGCFGIYLFVRDWSSPVYGILAGMVFAVVPYHFAQVYRFFLYAEFAAMAAVPFFLLYLTRICRDGKWMDVILLAVSGAVLILTHIPVTLMMAFTVIVYIPIALDLRRWKTVSVQLAFASALAAAATMFYWIRVVREVAWVAHSDPRYTIAGYKDGPMLFPYLLVDYDITYELPYLRHLDIVTVLTIAVLIPALLTLVALRKTAPARSLRVSAAAICSAAFGIFMFSKPSGFLWSGLSILSRLQYPWRWLAIVSALAVVAISFCAAQLVGAGRILRRTALWCAVLLILGFVVVDIKQLHGTPNRISSRNFNTLAEEVRSEAVAEHWWPSWAKVGAFKSTEQVATATGRTVQITAWENGQRRFIIGESSEVNQVRVATFYYPHWLATVNGREVEVGSDANGLITVPVGRERADVAVRFREPIANEIASYISLATWIFLVGYLSYRSVFFQRR